MSFLFLSVLLACVARKRWIPRIGHEEEEAAPP
jgi:hypothetical protein